MKTLTMKNMLKQPVGGRGGSASVHSGGAALLVTDCMNLRAAAGGDGSVLVPAGVPRVLAGGTHRPLAVDGDMLLTTDGRDLFDVPTRTDGAVPRLIASLPASPSCAVAHADGVTVMTGAGPVELKRSAGHHDSAGGIPVWPALTVRAAVAAKLHVDVGGGTFDVLARSYVEAYRQLADMANAQGQFMQPVVARCRLLDSASSTLYVTPPVAVMLPGGAQLTEALRSDLTAASDGDNPVAQAATVYADTFRLEIIVDGDISDDVRARVAAMTVEVTGDIHPCDMKAGATVTHNRLNGANEAVITLPRNGRGVGIAGSATAERLLHNAVAVFPEVSTVAATFPQPFAGGATTFTVGAPPVADVATAADRQYALLRTTVTTADDRLAQLTAPHTFTAEHAATNGAWTVWTDIARIPFGGYSAADFAASATPGTPWTGRVRVEFADGSAVSRAIAGDSCPETIGALLSYPDPTAVRMSVIWQAVGDTVSYGFTFPLTPDPSRRHAVYVHPTQKPWTPSALTEAVTPVAAAPVAMPGYLAVTNAGNPLCVRTLHRMPATLTDVRAAHGGAGAWEFGRARFYAFSGDAIRLVTLSSDGSRVSVSLLTARGVESAQAVAEGGTAVYALSGDTVLKLSGSTVRELPGRMHGNLLGYDMARGEILVGDTDDNEVRAASPESGMAGYTLTVVPSGPWLSAAGRVFAVADGSLCELTDCRSAAGQPVRWQAQVSAADGRRRRLRTVTWMLKAALLQGTLTVERMWLTGTRPVPAVMTRMRVDGAIRSPLTAPVNGRDATDYRLDLQAHVSADFALTLPGLRYLSQ